MIAAEEEARTAKAVRNKVDAGISSEGEVEAIQGADHQSTRTARSKRNNRQKKESKTKTGQRNVRREDDEQDGEEAFGEQGVPVAVPHFAHHLPGYRLIVEASHMMSREKGFKFGAVYVGEPNNPAKGSTCVYLLPDFKIPEVGDLRKDEVLFLVFGKRQTNIQTCIL